MKLKYLVGLFGILVSFMVSAQQVPRDKVVLEIGTATW